MSRLLASVFEGGAAYVMVNGFMKIQSLPISIIMQNQYGGHAQYLTIQGLGISVLCMTLGALSGLFPGISVLKSAKRLLMIIAMPISVVISIIYWSLLTFFPTLIMPDFNNLKGTVPTSGSPNAVFRLPLSIDLALHAVPAVALIVDFFVFEKKYSKHDARVVAPTAAVLFALWYATWAEHCSKHNNGTFPYPFLTESNFPGRVGIYGGATLMAYGAFRLINRLHR